MREKWGEPPLVYSTFFLFFIIERVSGRRRVRYRLFTTTNREHRATGVRVVVQDMLILIRKSKEVRSFLAKAVVKH